MTERAPATAVAVPERAAGDTPAVLAICAAGAVLATVSCFLPWVRLDLGRFAVFFGTPSYTIAASARGLGAAGSVAVAASIVMLLCVAGLLAGGPSMRSACAWILTCAGVVVAAVAITALATKGARADQVLRAAWQAGAGRALPAAQFDRLRDVLARLGSTSSIGPGVYLAVVGGALGAVGGCLAGIASARARRLNPHAVGTRGFEPESAERPA
jgi:hypothetical protein